MKRRIPAATASRYEPDPAREKKFVFEPGPLQVGNQRDYFGESSEQILRDLSSLAVHPRFRNCPKADMAMLPSDFAK
jgi:hypothetical protein